MWHYSITSHHFRWYVQSFRLPDYQNEADPEKLCDECTKLIATNPQDYNSYLKRALAYDALKKYDLAIQDLAVVIKLDPDPTNSPKYYYMLHLEYFFLGDLDKSLEEIKKAVNSDYIKYRYYRALAYIYEKLGQRDQAIMVLNKGVKESQDDNNRAKKIRYLERAEFYEEIGHFEEAIKDVTMAINLEPDWLISYHDRVSIYIKMKQYEKALDDCNICIEKDPKKHYYSVKRRQLYH